MSKVRKQSPATRLHPLSARRERGIASGLLYTFSRFFFSVPRRIGSHAPHGFVVTIDRQSLWTFKNIEDRYSPLSMLSRPLLIVSSGNDPIPFPIPQPVWLGQSLTPLLEKKLPPLIS